MKYLTAIIFIIAGMAVEGKAMPDIKKINNIPVIKNELIPRQLLTQFINLKPRDITRLTGKKLSFKEKIAWIILQREARKQMRHSVKDDAHNNGNTSFILGLIGLICIFIPFLIIASIPLAILAIAIGIKAKKEDPHDKKARTGIKLGKVTLGLIALIIVIVGIVLTVGAIFD